MTPERYEKLRHILRRRQLDLTVVLDNVHKSHNISAILRSCDATGVHRLHAVWPHEQIKIHHMTSGGSRKWVQVETHRDLKTPFAALKEQGVSILAAHWSDRSVDYREIDFTKPTAFVMGAELEGVGAYAEEHADQHVYIPMMGMVQSLNVSVATALLLFEAQRQRQQAGMYERVQLSDEEFRTTLFEWAYPELAELCRKRGFAYPDLDEEGEIQGELPR